MPTRPQPPEIDRISTLGRAITLIHTGRADRRSDLTDQLRLTRTATGAVLRDLENLHLVHTEVGSRAECGGTGRPSRRVEIHPDAPIAIGAQVHNETIAVLDVRLGGVAGQLVERPLPRPATPEAV